MRDNKKKLQNHKIWKLNRKKIKRKSVTQKCNTTCCSISTVKVCSERMNEEEENERMKKRKIKKFQLFVWLTKRVMLLRHSNNGRNMHKESQRK